MDQHKIGDFISYCRKEKGLTQVELAEMLGVSDKSISRWENAKTMPDISLYEPLCEALEIQVAELLYAKKMTDSEKAKQGEQSALNIFKTKLQLKIFSIFSKILIFIGIIITITLTKTLAVTVPQIVVTIACGSFVWGVGIILSIKIKKAILILENQ
ncbi:MAG: helix-turn-helix transcriptional regulator [[Ruminococcus] gnavus]|nr:helix-turn-helix transcriptional regulator [Mediterraneibacter gnavus]